MVEDTAETQPAIPEHHCQIERGYTKLVERWEGWGSSYWRLWCDELLPRSCMDPRPSCAIGEKFTARGRHPEQYYYALRTMVNREHRSWGLLPLMVPWRVPALEWCGSRWRRVSDEEFLATRLFQVSHRSPHGSWVSHRSPLVYPQSTGDGVPAIPLHGGNPPSFADEGEILWLGTVSSQRLVESCVHMILIPRQGHKPRWGRCRGCRAHEPATPADAGGLLGVDLTWGSHMSMAWVKEGHAQHDWWVAPRDSEYGVALASAEADEWAPDVSGFSRSARKRKRLRVVEQGGVSRRVGWIGFFRPK
jgi:hypothetical protein